MRIIWNELKKIITWKIMIALLVVSVVFYQLFMMFNLTIFPNGRPAKDDFNLSQEMIKKYGKVLDKRELADFKNTYIQRVNEATRYLQSRNEMKESGLNSYEKFRNADLNNTEQRRLHDKVFFENNTDLFWELQSREYIIERYDHPERFGNEYEDPNSSEAKRVKDLLKSRNAYSIFPYLVYDNYNELAAYLGVLIFLSVMIVVTPLYLNDRKNNVNLLQYTSKTGRTVFLKKFVAAFIAVIGVISIQLACFFSLYKGNNTGQFFSIKISSLFNAFISWYNLTFFQYIILTVICMYILGLVVLCLVAFISRIAPNYMTNIGMQVPLAAILFWLGIEYFVQDITSLYLPKYFLVISLIVLLGISVFIFMFRWRKERMIDIQ